MDLFNFSIVLLVVAVVLGFVWLLWFKLFAKKNVIRVFLFERVGRDKIFKYFTRGVEKNDSELGTYIAIGKDKIPISDVCSDDFFADIKFGKCLMVCKYASDDFRPMSRLKDSVWFRRELVERPVLDKNGKAKVELVVVDGVEVEKPVLRTVEELVEYNEPLGVNQQAREAMRFNRSHAKRMQSLRGDGASFWDKYGSYIMSGATLIIVFMIVVYTTNKNNESVKYVTDKWSEKADGLISSVQSPSFAENMLRKVEDKQANANSPPS